AAPLLARQALGDRVIHQAGNALTTDFGEERYEVIFIGQLVHHFDDRTNEALVARAARALKPGGELILYELIRPASAKEAGQFGGLGDLFFSMMSRSGTWTLKEMEAWQRSAGLVSPRSIRLLTAPGMGLQMARKPAAPKGPRRS